MSKVPYVSVVGCLMNVIVCIRTNLAQAVSKVCKFMSKPRNHPWEVVNWIFMYLKGTMSYGIVFNNE